MTPKSTGARLLDRFLEEAKGVAPSKLRELGSLREIHAASPDVQMEVVSECVRAYPAPKHPRTLLGKYADIALNDLFLPLLRDGALPYSLATARPLLQGAHVLPRSGIVKVFERLAQEHGFSDELRGVVLDSDVLRALHAAAHDPLPRSGDAWSDAALADLGEMPASHADAWRALFDFLSRNAPAFAPDDAWHERTTRLRAAVGDEAFRKAVTRWLLATAVSPEAPTSRRAEHNAMLLHGFVAMLDATTVREADVPALLHAGRVAFAPAHLPKLGFRILRSLRGHPAVMMELAHSTPLRRPKAYAAEIERVGC